MTNRWITIALLAGSLPAAPPPKSGIDPDAIDKTCKPCEDFYRYANGGWLDRNPLPPTQSRWGTFSILSEANKERMRVILESAAAAKARPGSPEQKIGDMYAACMDESRAESLGLKPIQGHLAEIDKINSRQDLFASMVRFAKTPGLSAAAPAGFSAGPDAKNSSQVVAYGGVPGLSLPDREIYLKDDPRSKKLREEFVAHVDRMMKAAGITATDPGKTLLAFETEMAAARKSRVEMRDPYARYNKLDLAGLTATAPSVPWKELLTAFAIPDGTPMIFSDLGALKMFEKQLNETPVETWKLAMKWDILSSAAPWLTKALADESFAFSGRILSGTKEQLPRWQRCSQLVDNTLGDALGQVFVQKHFPQRAKDRMTELVENLRATLREELEKADWLDPETRKNATAKLNAFDAKVGHPAKWRDYAAVTVKRDSLIETLAAASMEARKYNLAKIGKPVDRTEWGMTPPTVNAYYSPLKNEIVFPAGILQPPFFDVDADDAANYGAIGSVIGHEMGHGFDDQGSKFDFSGNLKNWWTGEDRKKFDERVQCVVDLFNGMEVESGLKHNGRLVVGEALGDLGGVSLAFKAYQRSLRGKPAPPVIDGYTGEQRFFLSFARVWGNHLTPEALRMRLQTDPHPLGKFRANATLMNLPEFHKAFSCKRGDPMVRPEGQRCRLW